MTLDEYTNAAQRTSSEKYAARTSEGVCMKQLENGLMGLCGESGECMEILKKHRHQCHPLDRAKLKEELGDVLWYVAEAAVGAGFTLDEIARGNVEKLLTRYPAGFDPTRSVRRGGQGESPCER